MVGVPSCRGCPVAAVTGDVYRDAAEGWATGASLVYGPLAQGLVTSSPLPLEGRVVLDVGAGTGVASERYARRPWSIATDLSHSRLAFG